MKCFLVFLVLKKKYNFNYSCICKLFKCVNYENGDNFKYGYKY